MREGRASRTAQHNALFRAIEARRPSSRRVADDRLAVHFLPLEFRTIAEFARVPPIRRLIETVIDLRWPGPRAGVIVRTRLFDDRIREALASVDQVLFLGAGFDTRAYRIPGIEKVPVFEVDHPATQSLKEEILGRAIGRLPSNVTFVPVEFGRDDLAEALRRTSFARNALTLVLWEGVTNYLTAASVDATFRVIAASIGSGSPVLFTYIDRSVVDGSASFEGASESAAHVRRIGEPYTFGFDPSEVSSYVDERGFDLLWDVAVADAAERYYSRSHSPKVYAYYHAVEARRR